MAIEYNEIILNDKNGRNLTFTWFADQSFIELGNEDTEQFDEVTMPFENDELKRLHKWLGERLGVKNDGE